MNVIVAVDQQWGIGLENDLQFRIRSDLRHFRALTLGKTIIYGRKTLQTFPSGQPLPGRTNIVLTRQSDFPPQADLIVCHSLEELWTRCGSVDSDDLFVIGGANVYEQLLPYCRRAFVTRIDATRPADRYFPKLDQSAEWRLMDESPIFQEQDLGYRFQIYDHV